MRADRRLAAFIDAHPHGATHEEIAAELGLSHDEVRTIERRALAAFRAAMAGGPMVLSPSLRRSREATARGLRLRIREARAAA